MEDKARKLSKHTAKKGKELDQVANFWYIRVSETKQRKCKGRDFQRNYSHPTKFKSELSFRIETVIYHSSLLSITTGPLLFLFLICVDSYFSHSLSFILVGPWKETAIHKSVQCEFKKKSSSIAWIKYCVTFYSKVFWRAISSLQKALSPSLPQRYPCTWCIRPNRISQKMCPSQYLWMWFYLRIRLLQV